MLELCDGSIGKLEEILEKQEIYIELEKWINKIEKTNKLEMLNEAEILYKEKENIINLLEYINVWLYMNAKQKNSIKYADCVTYIEEAKHRIALNSNYDMTIDNLLLKMAERLQ